MRFDVVRGTGCAWITLALLLTGGGVARSGPSNDHPVLQVTRISTDLNGKTAVVVADDAAMRIESGRGGKVTGVVGFTSVDEKFQVDVSEYDQLTLSLKDWPVDEFMLFLDGRVDIRGKAGERHIFGPGQAMVMPAGFDGTWRQLSRIKKIAVSYHPARGGKRTAMLAIDRAALGRAPTKPVGADASFARFVEKDGARYAVVHVYTSDDRKMLVEMKKYDRIVLEMKGWPTDEFMYLLSGHVQIADSAGRSQDFGPGDALVVPRGFSGMWKQLDKLEMFTVNYGSPD